MSPLFRFSCVTALLLASACGDDGDASSSGSGSGGDGAGGEGQGGDATSDGGSTSSSTAGGGDSASSGGEGGASCVERAQGAYVLAVSIQLGEGTPLYFDAAVVQSGAGLSVELTPLRTPYRDAGDPMVPVGTSFNVSVDEVRADGAFSLDTGNVAITGEANPFSGADMLVSMTLTGTACPEGADGAFCGAVSGTVIDPIALDLTEGSNFFAFNDQGAIPVYDCDGTLAETF